MTKKLFFKYLAVLTFILALAIVLLSFIPFFQGHLAFSWSSWGFFTLFTIGVYFLANQAAQSPNLNTYSSVILGVIFIKMVFIIFIVLIYKKLMDPGSPWFLVPFFIIYLSFTIFEIYFMSKLGRLKPEKSEVQSTSK